MKLPSITALLYGASLCVPGACLAGDWSPTQPDLDRYEPIWKSAPFVAATSATPQAESLAQRYGITGFARVGERYVVFLYDRKGLNRFAISRDSARNGVELLSVQEGGTLKQVSAKIRVGTEVAVISYDLGTSPTTANNPASRGGAAAAPEIITSGTTSPTAASTPPKGHTQVISRGPIKGH